jgi:hypothetical protein
MNGEQPDYTYLARWGTHGGRIEDLVDLVPYKGYENFSDITRKTQPTYRGWRGCLECSRSIDPDQETLGSGRHWHHFWAQYQPIWQASIEAPAPRKHVSRRWGWIADMVRRLFGKQ